MTLVPLLVVTLLIAVNALYVAAEFAAVAVQKSEVARLAREGNSTAVGLFGVLDDGGRLDRYIAACQIGITVASLLVGAYSQATIGVELAPALEQAFSISRAASLSSAFLIVLLVLTVCQVVLGELVPKSLALQFPERTALFTYHPVRWSVVLYRGFIWLLNGTGFLLLRPFGVTPGGHDHVHSPQEIAILLGDSHRGGNLSSEAHKRLERGLLLSARTVRQMMTPSNEMHAIEASMPAAEVLQFVQASPYGRLPVYRGTVDNILGAVSTKDIVGHLAAHRDLPRLEQMLRPIPFVPETLRSHQLVRFLQRERSSKAMVIDEHGAVRGIISIEDVLRELFGEIGDELKQTELGIQIEDGTIRLSGGMRLDEAATFIGKRWEGPAATVGGHIVRALGRLPNEGETVEVDGVRLTVSEVGAATVRFVVVHPAAAADSSPPPAAPEGT